VIAADSQGGQCRCFFLKYSTRDAFVKLILEFLRPIIVVATVVGLVAEGLSNADILRDYPDLEQDDIQQALAYAAEAVRERQIPVRVA